MSFYTGTQCELLYAMPGSGTAVTGTVATAQLLSPAATDTHAPFQLPAGFFNFMSGTTLGKSLLIKGGGNFTTSSTANTLTWTFALDTTLGTLLNKVAGTGAITPVASITNGAWDFELIVTATQVGAGTSATSLNAVGHLNMGQANNAVTANFTGSGSSQGANNVMIGAPQTAVAVNYNLAYFLDVYASWSGTVGGPTLTMTNLLVFGLN